MLIISEPHKLIYSEVPKCASTAMFKFFLDLSDFRAEGNPRKIFSNNRSELQEKAGLTTVSLTGSDLAKFAEEHRDYYWFSVVRDPYSRILSNYHNKLNRFAHKFNRSVYFRGKLSQFLGGPNAWSNANRAAEAMQEYLPFEQFVDGLRKHGISFDSHYRQQCDILSTESINYNRLIRLEHFNEGISELLDSRNLECGDFLAKNRYQRLNASTRRATAGSFFTNEIKTKIYDLYRQDFEFLERISKPSQCNHYVGELN
jgi:hypothetical protein